MPWYRAGSVAVTNGSATVTGAGTDFVGNTQAGEVFLGPDGRVYEISAVQSATQLTIIPNYQGASAGGQAYGIQPTASFARDLAVFAAQMLNTFGAVRDGIGQGLMPDGTVLSPGLRFAADQDTGLRRAGDNVTALTCAGVDRVLVGPAGATVRGRVTVAQGDTVGVPAPTLGTLPPSSAFFGIEQVFGLLIGTYGSNGSCWLQAQRTDGNADAYNLLLQPSGGNLGVGTTSPSAKLHVSGASTTVRVESVNVGATDTQLAIKTPERQWNIGQNVGGSGQGTLNFFDVTAGALRLSLEPNGTVRPGIDNGQSFGTASARWSVVYAGTGSIATSDEREKNDIDEIPSDWLDAWGDVQWCRFRFRDAIAAKGEDARWHLGLIAQQVRDSFASRGLDAQEIGLLCHDTWEAVAAVPATDAVFDAEGVTILEATPGSPARPAGERWGLRYDECQAIEAAWQRRRIAQLEDELAALRGVLAAQHG